MSLPGAVEDELDAELVVYATTRDPELREKLIEGFLPLAERIARHFTHRGEPYDDLVQAGTIGLIKAVDRYQPERGSSFSNYATKTIAGELKRHFRDKGWSVRPPRRVQELHLHLSKTISELSQSLGRSPTIGELAAATSSSNDEVLEALEAGQTYHSLSLDSPGEWGETVEEKLGSVDVELESAELRVMLAPHIAGLSERDQLVIRLRFEANLTQSEIAQTIGLSQMHVSRILSSCIERLHSAIQTTFIDFSKDPG